MRAPFFEIGPKVDYERAKINAELNMLVSAAVVAFGLVAADKLGWIDLSSKSPADAPTTEEVQTLPPLPPLELVHP